jgi:hypothetical protein
VVRKGRPQKRYAVRRHSPVVGTGAEHLHNRSVGAPVHRDAVASRSFRPPPESLPGAAGLYCLPFSRPLDETGAGSSDKLRTPAGLAEWLVSVGLAADPCVVTIPELRRAHHLCDAIRRLLLASSRHEPPPPPDRLIVNAYARQRRVRWQVTADWRREPCPETNPVEVALATIAVDAVDLATCLLNETSHGTSEPRRCRLSVDVPRR